MVEEAAPQAFPGQASEDDARKQEIRSLIAEAQAPLLKMIQDLMGSMPTVAGASQQSAPTVGRAALSAATATEEAATTSALSSCRKALPLPSKFSGNRSQYPAWRQQMNDKLQIDIKFFESAREAWYLIYSCLDVGPQQVVATFYATQGEPNFYQPKVFFEYLDRNYADPNLKAKATAMLRSLKQKDNESFASYLPKFERTITEAGGTAWPDETQIAFLESGISERLRLALVPVQLPTNDYIGWLARVQDVAWRMERLNQRGTLGSIPSGTATITPPVTVDGDGDRRMGGVNRVEGSSKKKEKKKAQDKKKRREAGLNMTCYRCHEEGHLIAQCPQPRTRAAATTVSRVVEISGGDTEEESENE